MIMIRNSHNLEVRHLLNESWYNDEAAQFICGSKDRFDVSKQIAKLKETGALIKEEDIQK